jgi:REP element-mobilizing transposase RayT
MEKFKSKYRIKSTRLRNWNYGTPGFYFITICTRNREHYFGEIKEGEMLLNKIGQIADDCWSQIPLHFPNAELGDFIIMPNHVHGIIIMNGIDGSMMDHMETDHALANGVETGHALSLQNQQQPNENPPAHFRFRNQGKNTISAITGSFKSAVTKLVHQLDIGKNFGWQSRFYDHIIRSQDEYIRISNYIMENPVNWKNDRFFNPVNDIRRG